MCKPEKPKKRLRRRALYDQVLRCIDREDNLINYRMSWCLQWNFAFFAALFALHGKDSVIPPSFFPVVVAVLVVGGTAVSIISFLGIRAAHDQLSFLIFELESRLGVGRHNWDCSEFIRPYGNPHTAHPTARRVAKVLPLLLALIWGIIGLSIIAKQFAMPTPAERTTEWTGTTLPASPPAAVAPPAITSQSAP